MKKRNSNQCVFAMRFLGISQNPLSLELDGSCSKTTTIKTPLNSYCITLIGIAFFHGKTPILAKFKFVLKKYAKLKLRYIAKGIWTQKVWIQSYSCCRIAQTWHKSSILPKLENILKKITKIICKLWWSILMWPLLTFEWPLWGFDIFLKQFDA